VKRQRKVGHAKKRHLRDEDHDGCRQIHGVPKGSLGSHLGLHNPVHARHYVLDGQRFKFFGDILLTAAFASLGESDNSHYAFPVAYREKRPGVSMCNIFQSNLCIAAHSSLSCLPIGICRTLFLRSNSVPLPRKSVLANTQVLKGASSSCSFIGSMRVVVLKGGDR
jgi:hypothetical protein